ncbi:PilZ domain-containing protein [Trichlorobacter lovleyi]|uniref:PilZ domain-containing protein n=1 Tax=Trichlorobacter lovleyi TaxID=313985 RepID=UPI002480230D|nr:PilZ domain-containing protein [Trichlorobacter lovleyi]
MNITDLYSTRIQKNFDEDQAEILAVLQANLKQPLKLINYYKGIPLSYPATIASISKGIVDLDVHEVQAFTIEQTHSAFIRSPLFRHALFAQAQYVNVSKRAAAFVQFSYVEIMAEHRSFVRVAVDSQEPVSIESPLGTIEGQLYDISLSGLNILIDHTCPLEPGAETTVQFVLRSPETAQAINARLPATLIGIAGDVPPYSYRFAINPEKQLESQISQYIFQRQVAIIRGVKEVIS